MAGEIFCGDTLTATTTTAAAATATPRQPVKKTPISGQGLKLLDDTQIFSMQD